MDLTDKSQLLQYLKENGLWAKKSLGQNFLIDREALDTIIEAAGLGPDDTVIEVGPGIGTLTRELVESAGRVIAVELDQKLAESLVERLCHPELDSGSRTLDSGSPATVRNDDLAVINADILKLNITELTEGRPYKVVANIPYYITSKILQLFLTQENKPETIVMLVQKEVAERVCAKPGQLSILALSVQAYGEPEIVGIVPKESFFPAPKIDSAILRINNIRRFHCHSEAQAEESQRSFATTQRVPFGAQDDNHEEKDFFRLIHIGFASKRKTLVNNLAAGLHIDKSAASDIIKSIGLSGNVRAQELSLSDWATLAGVIKHES